MLLNGFYFLCRCFHSLTVKSTTVTKHPLFEQWLLKFIVPNTSTPLMCGWNTQNQRVLKDIIFAESRNLGAAEEVHLTTGKQTWRKKFDVTI